MLFLTKGALRLIRYPSSTSWELPDNVPYPAKKVLVDTYVRSWKAPTLQCFNGVAARLDALLSTHVAKNFDQFPKLREYIRCASQVLH